MHHRRGRSPRRAAPNQGGFKPAPQRVGRGAAGLRVLIAAGPTREPIDPVRFLSNYSTGYLGAQLATEALGRGHRVTVVLGPAAEPMPRGARVIPVTTAREMAQALRRAAGRADAIIMAAAVCDFRPSRVSAVKLKRRPTLTLALEATPDLIGRLPRRASQVVVGFALESGRVVARATQKLRTKRLDMVLAQEVGYRRSPFGSTRVRAWVLARGGDVTPLGWVRKRTVARVLLDKIERLWYGQQEPKPTRDVVKT